MLHGIGDDEHPADLFEDQIRYLKRNFRIVPLEELLRRPGSGAIALTFDDGLKNQLTHAYPILRRHRLPATFFVCPQLVDEGRWLWVHEIRARLASMPEPILRNPEPLEWMKALPLRERNIVEEKVRAATPGFTPTEAARRRCDLMNWDELNALDPSLITIGSHSLTHPILTTLDPDELLREVRDSRALLEERLGRPVPLFCYPNGTHDDAVVACVREHYDAAVIADSGFVDADADPHRLQRLIPGTEITRLAWYLHRPGS